MNKYKLAIVMRTDLGMGKGKMCVQAGHASVLATYDKCDCPIMPFPNQPMCDIHEWLEEGQFKTVLKCPDNVGCGFQGQEGALHYFEDIAQSYNLPVVEVRDFGKTQVESNTLTCIAIGPALCEEVDKVTGGLKLL
jgi:PTH2 family peptidyl-tRNA hydrolase